MRFYNVKNNPAVIEGRKTETQAQNDFLATFETSSQGANPDGKVSLDEFVEYYNNISASIENEIYFVQLLNSSWDLDGNAN
jgi:calcyphosin